MSENNKKIYKVVSQTALAQQWALGNDAVFKDIATIENGVIIAKVYRYNSASVGYSYTTHRVVLGYTEENGDRVVYNYTANDLSLSYLWCQKPNPWNNNQPRYPNLVFAEIGKGKPLNTTGLSSQFICKLVEKGKATKILLPPEKGHEHYADI